MVLVWRRESFTAKLAPREVIFFLTLGLISRTSIWFGMTWGKFLRIQETKIPSPPLGSSIVAVASSGRMVWS